MPCQYLGIHELLADALLERAEESVTGRALANCSLCKYRVQIIGYEKEVGAPQQGHHFHVRGGAGTQTGVAPVVQGRIKSDLPLVQAARPHPIEAESFRIIEASRDWSTFPEPERDVLKRLVHASGDFNIVDEVFMSPGAVAAGIRALSQRLPIITDVVMVQSGLRRTLLDCFGLTTICAVHDEETRLLAEASGITRSAAGIRRAWMQFGNNLILAIGDAPTAVEEAVRLVDTHSWRPHLIIGLPVGFVGTESCKEKLRQCLRVPRITNRGTRGGSPWAAAVMNAMLIRLANQESKK